MKTGILGLLLGGYLFVSGVSNIDDNYTIEYWPQREAQLYFNADYDVPEAKAYMRGVVGSAFITLSVKHLWDQHKSKTQQESINKFRETIQILAGLGLTAAGFELHDLGARYDQTVMYQGKFSDPAVNHHKEYMGFMIGAVGTAMVAYSTKQLWDNRGSKTAQELSLDFGGREFKQYRTESSSVSHAFPNSSYFSPFTEHPWTIRFTIRASTTMETLRRYGLPYSETLINTNDPEPLLTPPLE